MKTINKQYLKESTRDERRAHLNLRTECLERGGNSTNHKGILAQYLNTTIPAGRVLLCHACHNSKCSNPLHLYWGSDTDNNIDAKENGTFKNIHERTIEKYGEEKVREMRREVALRTGHKGGIAGKGRKKSPEHIEKIRQALLGKKASPEARKNMSEAAKRRRKYITT